MLSMRTYFLIAWLLIVLSGCRPSASGLLEKGTQLPNVLDGAVMRNAPVDAAPPTEGWVIYVFSPAAPESARNGEAVERLARSLPPGWTLLAVAMDTNGLPAFLRQAHPTVPVLSQVPDAALGAYRIAHTPRTYVLDKDWKLLEAVDGVYAGARFKGAANPPPAAGPAAAVEEPGHLCLDQLQRPYSRGGKAQALGRSYQCGEGGAWVPAS